MNNSGLIFYGFYQIGGILGDYNSGIFIYNVLQAGATALAFSAGLCAMESRNKAAALFQKAGFLYFACMPYIAMFAITMVKDSLFSLFFVLYFLNYNQIVHEGINRKNAVRLIVLSTLLAVTKKTGVYFVLLSNPALLFVSIVRKNAKQAAAVLVSAAIPALVIFVLFARILFPALRIYPGGEQEALGICFQQTARVVMGHEEELSEDEKSAIAGVLEYDRIRECYDYASVDGIKLRIYRFDSSKGDRGRFLKTWCRLGLRYPAEYIKAVIEVNGHYFESGSMINPYYRIARNDYGIFNPESKTVLRDGIRDVYEWMQRLPVLGIFFRKSLYAFWLPLFVFACSLQRKTYYNMICLIPIAVSVLFLIVGPITSSRYLLPQLYTAPFVFGLAGIENEM